MTHELILIVEDEKIAGMDVRLTAQELGYHSIGPIASGKDGVTLAPALRPDVVLMDILLRADGRHPGC